MAQRNCGGLVCLASIARRIGGVGVGTQGCVEHFFLDADAHRVHSIRAKTVEGRRSRVEGGHYGSGSRLSTLDPRLSSGAVVLRVRADVQADGGDVAFRLAAAGFLALEPFSAWKLRAFHHQFNRRKTALPRTYAGGKRGDLFCANYGPGALAVG